jgi:hypothetical protein
MKQQRIPLPDPRETAKAARIALETAIKDAPAYGAKVGQQRIDYYRQRLEHIEQREKERGIAA